MMEQVFEVKCHGIQHQPGVQYEVVSCTGRQSKAEFPVLLCVIIRISITNQVAQLALPHAYVAAARQANGLPI
ncbi:MAG: hypothetical protein ACYCXT_10180 [Acidiferrobacteraceae bacterium]